MFFFNLNFVMIISIIEILGIPNTGKYFLLCYYINILLVFNSSVRDAYGLVKLEKLAARGIEGCCSSS